LILTTAQLKRILGAGGGLAIDASTLTFTQLRDITAATATNGKATLAVRNLSGLTAAQLLELSALAPGSITFDLTA
jgi:hypothetical protein